MKPRARGRTVVGDLTRDVFEAAAAVRDVGERLARTAGQSLARWQLLYLLDAQPRTVPSVARRLGLARQSIQRVADELVAERLVRTLPNPDHQRSPLHELTEDGRDALARINTHAATWHRKVLRALPAAELARGRRFLQRVTALAREATGDVTGATGD
jgi:DNA-binding MarR family transcriptional regulator